MSASWHSEMTGPARLRGARAVLAALAFTVLATGAAEARRAASTVDSTGTVRRISISDRGIVVDRGLSDTTWDRRGEDVGERVGRRIGQRMHARMRDHGLIEVDDEGTGIVRLWSDAYVPAGDTVDGDVVAVFGSVTVEGAVSRDVVAVFGSVHLRPGAQVEGDVVSIGGVLDQADSTMIRGESVQLGFSPFTWGLPGLSVLLFAIAAGWMVSMFMGWIFTLLFPTVMLRVATVVERRPAASFLLGMLSVPMFFVTLVLLCITVIGIPLGILLPVLYMAVGYAGQLAATAVLGARLSRRSLASGIMTPLLVGTLFVAAVLAIGAALMTGGALSRPASLLLTISGVLLLTGLGTLGTGAFLLSRFGTRPRDVTWHGHAPVSPAPGAVPGSVAPPATG